MLALDLVEHQRRFLVAAAVEPGLAERIQRADVARDIGRVGAGLGASRAAGEKGKHAERGEGGQAVQAILHGSVLAEPAKTGKPLPPHAEGV